MNEPVRLVDSADELTRSLLRHARAERPREALQLRVRAAALGVAAGGSTVAAAAGLSASSTLTKAALAWFVAGAGIGTVICATALIATRTEADVSPAPVAATAAAGEPAGATAPGRAATAPPAENRLPARDPRPAASHARGSVSATPPAPAGAALADAGATPAGVDPLSAEVARLDGARRALAAGDSARALALTEADARLLGPETRVIRIEALLGAERRAEAAVLARRFLAEDPGSPHAARVRSLLAKSAAPVTDPAAPGNQSKE